MTARRTDTSLRHKAQGHPRERGTAAVEFALALPLLAGLALMLLDLQLAAVKARQAEGLARAGLEAIVRRLDGEDLSSLVQPVAAGATSARGLGLPPLSELILMPAGVLGSALLFPGCPTERAVEPTVARRCPDGSAPSPYAEVAIKAPVTRVLPWPEHMAPATVEARALGRVG